MQTKAKMLGDIDVICQHTCKGDIIPLRIRVRDNDGEFHVYNIKNYKNLSDRGSYMTSDGVYVTNHVLVYECKIIVFGVTKCVKLYYDLQNNNWRMTLFQ